MGRNRILLVDSHNLLRRRLRRLIDNQTDMEIVAVLDESQDPGYHIARGQPDLLILTARRPMDEHLRMIADIAHIRPGIKTLIASPQTNAVFFRQARCMGAAGYILTHTSDFDLLRAIRVIVRGGMSLPVEMAQAV